MQRISVKPALDHIRAATSGEWDAAWAGCDHATFFQSRAWAESWAGATGGRVTPSAKHVLFDDGEVAVVPLSIERKSFGLSVAVTSLAATYGGWLSAATLGRDHAQLLVHWLVREFRDLTWKLNPFDEALRGLDLPPTQADDTQVIDLEPGFEAIKRAWTKGHRAAASQARRAGVRVRLATNTSDWETYFRIYEDSLRRWGTTTLMRHPWSIFEELRQLDSLHVKLWLAEHDGELIAGALCFYSRRHAVYWHGAVLSEAMSLRPVHALMHEVIQHACGQGDLRWFDFNPSGPLDGVRAFKKGFGPRTMACPTVRIQPGWLRAARRFQAALASAAPTRAGSNRSRSVPP